ncbi:LCP family protein [Amycolatopsis magusensis]|uniref:LCP family protein required for cell wall assembly n=1 Tax=Amycolatopsis magusensis TaxID=882444 RepID=A0ABS4PSC5_9PSEU|nr:LCP family protein [Amycolatopsis magusensis]MBP2182332.1 LCP family protein required for cell wall assembly [Amycolatopsis magusensis]
MTDEQLIRQAIADQAGQAPPAEEVLAGLREKRRRRPVLPVVAAALVVAAGLVAAFLVAGPSATPDAPVAAAPTETDVLLIGADESGRADAILLARLDTKGVLRAVSLPRDTWTGEEKLSQIFAARGVDGLVEAVQALTGVRPGHHAVLDAAGFVRLSDAVGGVEVCLRHPADDPRSGARFPAGKQTLSGDHALAFLRQRAGLPNGDLDRAARQRAFLQSLTTKLAGSTLDYRKLAAGNLRTDPDWDLADFAARVDAAGDMGVIPVLRSAETGAGSVLEVDPVAVKSFVDGFFAGAPGSGGQGGAAPCVN